MAELNLLRLNLLRGITSLLTSGDAVPFSAPFSATAVASFPAFSRQEATVAKAIEPSRTGRIRFQGSWWSARCPRNITIPSGELVNVVGRQNITLLVEPIASSRSTLPANANPALSEEKKEVQFV